ncbi:hypothetical protein [Raineyella fluvialis]|uniref:hypothetical protein n=1 Tax=Raineyella fluvialis TaxID=2662261 RepID=UPI001E618F0F|nr:hypothetical protein [Raineyella fluvialis]
MTTSVTVEELVDAASELAASGRRTILGITGAPGAGKSLLGGRLVEALGPTRAVLVPMDGFHLANAVLLAHGLRQVKGAIQTFDDAGYANLLERIRGQQPGDIVYAPSFDRDLEEPIAGSIPVFADVPWSSPRGTICWPTSAPGHGPAPASPRPGSLTRSGSIVTAGSSGATWRTASPSRQPATGRWARTRSTLS